MIKRCTKCKKRKPLTAFYKLKTGKNGIRANCIKCNRKAGKEYEQAHRVEINIRRKQWRKTINGCLRSRFQRIKQRCNNPKAPRYSCYGGRGIKCLFENADDFVNYVINELQADPRGLLLDRIDNDGNYEPGNIRFVTAKESANNRGRN